MYVCMYVCIYVYAYVYIYIYIYMYCTDAGGAEVRRLSLQRGHFSDSDLADKSVKGESDT